MTVALFLTGRDHGRMGLGTFQSLKNLGLWHPFQSKLVMKSDSAEDDSAYKARMCLQLRTTHKILVAMDNEPELVHVMTQCLPGSLVIFFHSTMSRRFPEQDINAEEVPTYSRLTRYLSDGGE